MNQFQSKELQVLLKQINSILDLLILIGREDLSKTIKFMREHHSTSKESTQRMAILSEQMQCFDFLCQRMEHAKIIHSWVLTLLHNFELGSAKTYPKSNLLRLNELQLRSGIAEYLGSIQSMQSVITETGLREPFPLPDKRGFLSDTTMIIASALPFLEKKFDEAGMIAESWMELDLDKFLERLETIYSMQSERTLLQAYISNPALQETELSAKAISFKNDTSSIDLFE